MRLAVKTFLHFSAEWYIIKKTKTFWGRIRALNPVPLI